MALKPRQTVEDHWKVENGGAWHQQPPDTEPAETVGWYWAVYSPMMGRPWKKKPAAPPPQLEVPGEFKALFGPYPSRTLPEYKDVTAEALGDAEAEWLRQAKNFVASGTPPWLGEIGADAGLDVWAHYGIGISRQNYFESKWGWRVMFPESVLPKRHYPAYDALANPHPVIAQFQIDMLQAGLEVTKLHELLSSTAFA